MKLVSTVACAAGCLFLLASATQAGNTVTPQSVVKHYADLAYAKFSDSLSTAKHLQKDINAFVENPTEEGFAAAKQAWLEARVPYGQTEVYRFGNPNVDDWEGKVNAWPLDEGLIDYVASDYEYEEGNGFGKANIIAGEEAITQELLQSYHEKGGSEANVATGYHAIEFLLWGQDLNQKSGDSGLRPYTDYVEGEACTNANCARRGEYLKAATDLLVSDLEDIVADWQPEADNYRKTFLALETNEALRRMLFGMGSLSLGELAGERINVALLAHSQEDEHSCFSDNTHVDIAENARGIQNVFNGTYTTIAGKEITGPSLKDLVAQKDAELAKALETRLQQSQKHAAVLAEAAEKGEHFDQQITPDNEAGQQRIKAVIEALRAQTGKIEAASQALGIDNLNPETSDSFGG